MLIREALAVAKAAVESGVARKPITDWDEYRDRLESHLGRAQEIMRRIIHKAKRDPKRIVFLEGADPKILRACQIILDERIAKPILLGNRAVIRKKAAELHLDLKGARWSIRTNSTGWRNTRRIFSDCAAEKELRLRRPEGCSGPATIISGP